VHFFLIILILKKIYISHGSVATHLSVCWDI